MNNNPIYPHRERRSMIHFTIFLLILVMIVCLVSCSPQNGCRATRGMSGYSYLPSAKELKKTIPYLYNFKTGEIFILNKKGGIVYTYQQP